MIRADRRALLRLAAAAAALPLLSAGPAAARARFAPPAAPMRYARRLERPLADGARLIVDRGFAVRFVREGSGFRVDGEQVDVAVEAPPQIEALARLERARIERGVFPLLLDAGGAIRSVAPTATSAQLDEAVREVAARIERGEHAPVVRDELRAFVDAVHRSAGALATELPRDLFAPAGVPREESRAIALPDGRAGRVTIAFTASVDPATGLMREARREVVTEVAGEARTTLESWRLTTLS